MGLGNTRATHLQTSRNKNMNAIPVKTVQVNNKLLKDSCTSLIGQTNCPVRGQTVLLEEKQTPIRGQTNYPIIGRCHQTQLLLAGCAGWQLYIVFCHCFLDRYMMLIPL